MFAAAGEDQAAFRSFVKTQRRRVCMSRRRANETCWLRAVVGRRKFRSSSWARQNRAAEVKRLKPSMGRPRCLMPVWSKHSCGLLVIVFQEATQAFAAGD